jgi:hypothetical protein
LHREALDDFSGFRTNFVFTWLASCLFLCVFVFVFVWGILPYEYYFSVLRLNYRFLGYAHGLEMGHAFSLPDLYDTNTASGAPKGIGLGAFDLMSHGNYGEYFLWICCILLFRIVLTPSSNIAPHLFSLPLLPPPFALPPPPHTPTAPHTTAAPATTVKYVLLCAYVASRPQPFTRAQMCFFCPRIFLLCLDFCLAIIAEHFYLVVVCIFSTRLVWSLVCV